MTIFQVREERLAKERADIEEATADFWSGLTSALSFAGAKFSKEASSLITVNGETISIDVYPMYEAGTTFHRGPWTGKLQVTYRRYRNNNHVWRTRKAGWPFSEIARVLIESANGEKRSRELKAKREQESAEVSNSPEWRALLDTAQSLGLYPNLNGSRVSLTLDLTVSEATTILNGIATERSQGQRDLNPLVVDAVRDGKLIAAIKVYRDAYGSSLLEAKNAVERIRDRLKGANQ
jgi:hypothetical protein